MKIKLIAYAWFKISMALAWTYYYILQLDGEKINNHIRPFYITTNTNNILNQKQITI